MTAIPNDVIQLTPGPGLEWGPLLCIVDKVAAWGVRCYALVPATHSSPEERGRAPSRMYLRVDHGGYVVIGPAEWTLSDGATHDDDD